MPMTIPHRMPKGRILLGPDFYGCINTGMAPALLKSKALADYPTLSRGFRFAVGPHLFVEQAVKALMFNQVKQGRGYYEFDGRRVTFCRTYATAKRRFAVLVSAAEAANAEARAEHNALRASAKTGYLQAVLGLMNY
jgi:hypothetical protein